jgi:hypothetical protein
MDQNPHIDIPPAVLPNGPQTNHTETPAEDDRTASEVTTARLDSLDTTGSAGDKGPAPDLATTQEPTSTKPATPPENPGGGDGESIGANLSDSPSKSEENTSKPQGPNATETEGPKRRKTRNSGTPPASETSSHQKPENCESRFPIKKIRIRISELPELSGALNSLAKFRAEHTYVAALTSALSRDALSLMMLMFPIIIAINANGKKIVGGSRTWAIAKTEQCPETTITAIEIGEIDDDTAHRLAVVDTFISGLYFCLTTGSIKLLQDGYKTLGEEFHKTAKKLLPGATKNKNLTKLTGLREQTMYDRRNSTGDPAEKPTEDQEKSDE